MSATTKLWLVMTLLIISFVLVGCKESEKAASTETKEFKSEITKKPEKPKDLKKKLFELGFKVEFKNDSEKQIFGLNKEIKDEWSIEYVSTEDKLYWQTLQDLDPTGLSKFAYTSYYYGDEPYKAFFGESGDITDGIIPSAFIQGMENISGDRYFEGVETLKRINEVKDTIKQNVELAENVKKGYEWTGLVTDYYTEGTEFAKGNKKSKVPLAIQTMNILNYAVIAGSGKEELGMYEWVFMNRPFKDSEMLQFEAEAVYYPKTTDLNSVMVEKIADLMYIYRGSELVEYAGAPEVNIETDGSGKQGKGVKTIIEWLLYDIYQVLDNKQPVYTQNYAEKLVEDYKESMTEFKVNTMLQKARDMLLLKDYEGALQSYEEVLKMDSNNYEALLGKGSSLLGLEKEDEAEKVFDELLSGYEEAEGRFLKFFGTRMDTTIGEISKYIRLMVIYDISYVLHLHDNYEKSIYYIEKGLEIKPIISLQHDVSLYILKMHNLIEMGKCEDVKTTLEKTKELIANYQSNSQYEELISDIEKKMNEDKTIICKDEVVEEEPEEDNPPTEGNEPNEILISYQVTSDGLAVANVQNGETIKVKVGDIIRVMRTDNLDRNTYFDRVLYSYGPLVSGNDDGKVDRYNFTIKAEKPGNSKIQILPLDEWDNEYKINVVVE